MFNARFKTLASACLLTSFSLSPMQANAGDLPRYQLVIKNHKFIPAELRVIAGEKFILLIDNQDNSPEEFESHTLHREKVIPANSKGKVFIGALKPGAYPFYGEFNEDSAQGKLIAE